MLMRGTKKHTREQIQQSIDRLKARVRVSGGATGASASIETTRENLPETLRLVAEILREPSFPATEFEQLRQENLAALENSMTDPQQMASTTLQKHLNPWPATDPRYVESPEESIEQAKAVKLDEVARFHAEFYGASAAEAALVGDFDTQAATALLTELFGDWKSGKPYARLAANWQERPAIDRSLEAPDKESAVFSAGLRIPLRDDAPEFPALVLGNFMTGGGFLSSRLAVRIRQKDGTSYGVGSYFYASSFDQDAAFGAYAIYAPQNAGRLVAAFREEIDKVLASGFTSEEIAEAKKGWLQGRQVSRANDDELAGRLTSREFQGRTLRWDDDLEKRVRALDNGAILAAMKQHIDPAKISMVQAGDFAKAKKATPDSPQTAGAR
jgi:zinc protease